MFKKEIMRINIGSIKLSFVSRGRRTPERIKDGYDLMVHD